jgi:hypothetical protein
MPNPKVGRTFEGKGRQGNKGGKVEFKPKKQD